MTVPVSDWVSQRCHTCAFWGGGTECSRDYPRTTITRDCTIRLFKTVRRRSRKVTVDAYQRRSIASTFIPYSKIEKVSMTAQESQIDKKSLKALLKEVNKEAIKRGFEGQIGFIDDFDDGSFDFPRRATQFTGVNRLLGGGWPFGAAAVLSGAPGAGKSTLMLQFIGYMQQQDPNFVAYWNDAENVLEAAWAVNLGVDWDRFIIGRFQTLEDGLNAKEMMIRKDSPISLYVTDSLDAAHPRGRFQTKKGKKRDIDDDDVALKARVMSDWFPRILYPMRKQKASVVFIHQLRSHGIGGPFVSKGYSGGNAEKHYNRVELFIRKDAKATWPTDNDNIIVGHTAILSTNKGSISGITPHDETRLTFFDNFGFDQDFDLVTTAINEGFLSKSSPAWTEFTDTNGEVQKVNAGKPVGVYQKLKEEGLFHAFYQAYTGEVAETQESEEVAEAA